MVMTGGLVGVGFGAGSDLLLVGTHDGRGIVDCLTGEKVARDRAPVYPDELTLRLEGIGPLAGTEIAVAGIFGGSLPLETEDGWVLESVLSNGSDESVRLLPPEELSGSVNPATFEGFIPEIRAFGFSPTGRSFVIATGADISIFAR